MDFRLQTALFGVVVVLVFLIPALLGWRRRRARDEARADLPELPADIETRTPITHLDGMYVATTVHGDTLDRVVGHGLGVRTKARVYVYEDGLLYDRHGARPLWIAAERITDHGTGAGQVGKFVEPGGLVLVTWSHGGRSVDTGFRPQEAAGRPVLLEALATLSGPAARTAAPTEDGAPQHGTPHDLTPQDDGPHDGAPHDGTPQSKEHTP